MSPQEIKKRSDGEWGTLPAQQLQPLQDNNQNNVNQGGNYNSNVQQQQVLAASANANNYG